MVISYLNNTMEFNQICVVNQAGSLNEKTINKGTAHVLEHVLLMAIEKKNNKLNIKGYVDFEEMAIMMEISAQEKNQAFVLINCLESIFDENSITLKNILKAKFQIIMEIMIGCATVKKQKCILRKIYKRRLLEMPVGNLYHVLNVSRKDIFAFYEKYINKEACKFIVAGKNAEQLKMTIENYLNQKDVIVENNEIYLPAERKVYSLLKNDSVLRIFLMEFLEMFFYENYQQDIHVEILDKGFDVVYFVFVNRKERTQSRLLHAMKNMGNQYLEDCILDNAKDKIVSYKGTVIDSDSVVSSLIEQSLGRGEAFIPERIEFDDIDWDLVFERTRFIIEKLFTNEYFRRI